ncbi:hypothetical protein S100141_04813 [Bacillus licheniformis]|nr:hypothetical protein S100141_04813 [Bacillus licheniformis]
MGALQQDVLNCFDDLFLDFDSAASKLNIHVNQLYNFKELGNRISNIIKIVTIFL